jgi:hypothetical protein
MHADQTVNRAKNIIDRRAPSWSHLWNRRAGHQKVMQTTHVAKVIHIDLEVDLLSRAVRASAHVSPHRSGPLG